MQVARESAHWFAEHGRSSTPYFVTIGMWEVHRPWPVEDYTPFPPDRVDVPPYLPDNALTRAPWMRS